MRLDEWIEHLGSDAATTADRDAAVTDGGKCLICALPFFVRTGPGPLCPHSEIEVIAFLRAKLDERVATGAPAACSGCGGPVVDEAGRPLLVAGLRCFDCSVDEAVHSLGHS